MRKTRFLFTSTLQTLVYADLFAFPLTKTELWQRLITPPQIPKSSWQKNLKKWAKQKKINYCQGYYFLPGGKKHIEKRRLQEKNWLPKFELVKKAADFIAQVPSVWFIGLTGNLALGVAKKTDDLDLMIITASNALWLSRLKIYWLLKKNGPKHQLFARKPGEKKVSNKLCLNLFLDGSDLAIKSKQQNLFTAYQIAFLKPLVNKHQVYEQFLAANPWAKKFLPNAFKPSRRPKTKRNTSEEPRLTSQEFLFPAKFLLGRWPRQRRGLLRGGTKQLNLFCYFLQRLYMKGKPKVKKITLTQAFFHPQDQSVKTLKRFNQKL